MTLPTFIIIGAAKSGTTTLATVLHSNPNIFVSQPKEIEFFARDDVFSLGLDWYKSHFLRAQAHQICGEASTIYSLYPHFPHTVPRLHRSIPDVKIVYIMREPVARLYSYYRQIIKNYQNDKRRFVVSRTLEDCLFNTFPNRKYPRDEFFASFDHHLPDKPELFLDGSLYAKQIGVYEEVFDRRQLHLMIYEKLMQEPRNEMDRLYRFLGLGREMDTKQHSLPQLNTTEDHVERIRRDATIERLRQLPLARFAARIFPEPLKERIYSRLSTAIDVDLGRKYPIDKMSARTRTWLIEYFREPNQALANLVGEDLEKWGWHL